MGPMPPKMGDLRYNMMRGVKNYDKGINDAMNAVSRTFQENKPYILMAVLGSMLISFLIGMAFMASLYYLQR